MSSKQLKNLKNAGQLGFINLTSREFKFDNETNKNLSNRNISHVIFKDSSGNTETFAASEITFSTLSYQDLEQLTNFVNLIIKSREDIKENKAEEKDLIKNRNITVSPDIKNISKNSKNQIVSFVSTEKKALANRKIQQIENAKILNEKKRAREDEEKKTEKNQQILRQDLKLRHIQEDVLNKQVMRRNINRDQGIAPNP